MKKTQITIVNGIKIQHFAVENGDNKKEEIRKLRELPANTCLTFSRAMGDDLDSFKKYFDAQGIDIDMNNVSLIAEYQPDGLNI